MRRKISLCLLLGVLWGSSIEAQSVDRTPRNHCFLRKAFERTNGVKRNGACKFPRKSLGFAFNVVV